MKVFSFLLPPDDRKYARTVAEVADKGTPLRQAIAPLASKHPGLSGIHPLAGAVEAYAARASLARAAKRSIDAQSYIWHADLTGTLLFNELRAAADRGVHVRLLLDDNNTIGLDAIIAALNAHPNIEVRLFNPFKVRWPRLLGYLTDFSRLNRRMHNKSFTADGEATIIGGRNIGDEYFGAGEGALFVDLDVLAVGPVVSDVARDFDRYWSCASALPAEKVVPEVAPSRREAVVAEMVSMAKSVAGQEYSRVADQLRVFDQLRERTLPLLWAPVQMLSDDPAKGLGRAETGDLLFSKLTEFMGEPQRHLSLVSAYFVPAKAGSKALAALVKRGVDVTVITNALEATDVPIVHAGYAKWRRPLLRAGVRIFEMRAGDGAGKPHRGVPGVGSAMGSRLSGAGSALHAKTIAVDGERAFVGSFNFDPRSANINTELGFVIENRALTQAIDAAFVQFAPARAYEVRLSDDGQMYWLERHGKTEVRHMSEPGTSCWQRAAVFGLSLLPIEWLL